MIKALLLVFDPARTWDQVVHARRGLFYVLCVQVLPLLLAAAVLEGYSLTRWGREQAEIALVKKFSTNEALLYETGQLLLTLAAVFIGAWIIKSVGDTFFGQHTFHQAFTVTAYGLSPWLVLRLADALPGTGLWMTWGLGAMLVAAVLYHGVPRVMRSLPPHTFGLYLMSVVSLVAVTGLVRFLTAWYLTGRCKPAERLIEQLAAQLPF
jgi:hypothetical protein